MTTRSTRRSTLWRVAAVVVVAACSTFLAACSSSTTTTTTSTKATTTTMKPPSAAQSRSEITSAYETLFDLSNPAVAPKLAVVQDGQTLKAAMTAELHSALAKEAHGATIVSISLLGPSGCQTEALTSPCAKVVYDIVGASRTPLLKNSVGFALYQPPTWKVTKTTICTLLEIASGTTPSGC